MNKKCQITWTCIELKFKRKINEEHMGDIPDFLYHVLESLKVLNRIMKLSSLMRML